MFFHQGCHFFSFFVFLLKVFHVLVVPKNVVVSVILFVLLCKKVSSAFCFAVVAVKAAIAEVALIVFRFAVFVGALNAVVFVGVSIHSALMVVCVISVVMLCLKVNFAFYYAAVAVALIAVVAVVAAGVLVLSALMIVCEIFVVLLCLKVYFAFYYAVVAGAV